MPSITDRVRSFFRRESTGAATSGVGAPAERGSSGRGEALGAAASPNAPARAGRLASSRGEGDGTIGAMGVAPIMQGSATAIRDTTYLPTQRSGDTEYRPELGSEYQNRAIAGTDALAEPGLDAARFVDRALVAEVDKLLTMLEQWRQRADEAWVELKRANEAVARLPLPWHRGWTYVLAAAAVIVGLVLAFGYMPLLGEAVDILFMRSWANSIHMFYSKISGLKEAKVWGRYLALYTPVAAAVFSFVIPLALNFGQMIIIFANSGKITARAKASILLVDLGIGGAVYLARVASALSVLALPAAAMEGILVLINTVVSLGIASALAKNHTKSEQFHIAQQVAANSLAWLDTSIAQAKAAAATCRVAVAEVGRRELSQYWAALDRQLAASEARIGYLEALRDNYADMLRASLPTDTQARRDAPTTSEAS